MDTLYSGCNSRGPRPSSSNSPSPTFPSSSSRNNNFQKEDPPIQADWNAMGWNNRSTGNQRKHHYAAYLNLLKKSFRDYNFIEDTMEFECKVCGDCFEKQTAALDHEWECEAPITTPITNVVQLAGEPTRWDFAEASRKAQAEIYMQPKQEVPAEKVPEEIPSIPSTKSTPEEKKISKQDRKFHTPKMVELREMIQEATPEGMEGNTYADDLYEELSEENPKYWKDDIKAYRKDLQSMVKENKKMYEKSHISRKENYKPIKLSKYRAGYEMLYTPTAGVSLPIEKFKKMDVTSQIAKYSQLQKERNRDYTDLDNLWNYNGNFGTAGLGSRDAEILNEGDFVSAGFTEKTIVEFEDQSTISKELIVKEDSWLDYVDDNFHNEFIKSSAVFQVGVQLPVVTIMQQYHTFKDGVHSRNLKRKLQCQAPAWMQFADGKQGKFIEKCCTFEVGVLLPPLTYPMKAKASKLGYYGKRLFRKKVVENLSYSWLQMVTPCPPIIKNSLCISKVILENPKRGTNEWRQNVKERPLNRKLKNPLALVKVVTTHCADSEFEASKCSSIHSNEILHVLRPSILCNADDDAEQQKMSDAISEIQLNECVRTKMLSASDFKTAPYKRAAGSELRDGSHSRPSKSQSFSERSGLMARFLKLKQASIVRTNSETPMRYDKMDHHIKLIEENTHEIVDQRISVLDRTVISNKAQECVHVGPVFVNLRNMASAASNLSQASVMLDTRHARNENAILGAFLCRVHNEDQQIVMFPGSKLPLTPNINKVLQIKAAIPNLDMEGQFQLMQTEAIVQTWQGTGNSIPTTYTLTGERVENLLAMQYKQDSCVVVKRPQCNFKALPTSIHLGRALSMRQQGSTFEVTDVPRSSVHFSVKEDMTGQLHNIDVERPNVEAELFGETFPEGLVDLENESNNFVFQDNFQIPLASTNATLLYSKTIAKLLDGMTGKAGTKLKQCMGTNCNLLIEIEGGLAPLVGAGVAVGYVESAAKIDLGLAQLVSAQHSIFNPFVEKAIKFVFRPNNHVAEWSPTIVRAMNSKLAFVFVGTYTNAPKTPVRIPFRISLCKASNEVPTGIRTLQFPMHLNGFELGAVEISQGGTPTICCFPVFPGTPRIYKGCYFWNQTLAFCAHFQAIKGKALVNAFVSSSSLIAGPVHISAVFVNKPSDITLDFLHGNPFKKVSLIPGNNKFVIDLQNGNLWTTCQNSNLSYSKTTNTSLCLVVWSSGSICSFIEGDFRVDLVIEKLMIEKAVGHSQSLVFEKTNATYSGNEQFFDAHEWLNADNSWVLPDHWNGIMYASLKDQETFNQKLNPLDLFKEKFKGVKGSSHYGMEASLALQSCSVWSSISYAIKATWWKMEEVEFGKCKHVVSLSIYPYGREFMSADHMVSSEPSGNFIANVEVTGPFEGLRCTQDISIAGQAPTGEMVLSVDNPKTARAIAVQIKVKKLLFGCPSAGIRILRENLIASGGVLIL